MKKFLKSASPYIQNFFMLFAVLSGFYLLASLFNRSLLEIPFEIIAVYFGIISLFVVLCGWVSKFIRIPTMSWRHYAGLAVAWFVLILFVVGIAGLLQN